MIRRLFLPAFAVALALFAVACGGDDDNGETDGEPGTGTNGESTSTATMTAASQNGTATGATNTPRATQTPRQANPVEALRALDMPDELTNGTVLSAGTPKVTLAIYEDFQCPHCLRFTATLEPQIVDEYVKTGKVRLEFKQLPVLGTESENAAVASTCAAAQDKFWPFHKKLFLVQAEAGQLDNERINVGRFSDAALESFANEVGLNMEQYKACYANEATVDRVLEDIRSAQDLGIRGTPSFVIDGKALPGSPATVADWRKVLDEALK